MDWLGGQGAKHNMFSSMIFVKRATKKSVVGFIFGLVTRRQIQKQKIKIEGSEAGN